LHRELIALRRARPWLTTADLEVTELANTHMAYTVTASTGSLLVQFDLSGAGPAELAGWQPIAVRDGWSVSERA
jgi:hypothetical protein